MAVIAVSRGAILKNRQNGTDEPAWVIRYGDHEVHCRSADFGTFRLVQEPMSARSGGICYIETDIEPRVVE